MSEEIKIFPANDMGLEYQIKRNQTIESLLNLANNKEQKQKMYDWFKQNFWQIGIDFSISKWRKDKMKGRDFEEMKQYYARNAMFKILDKWQKDCAIVEEISPLDIQGGYVVGEHGWGKHESRYRISSAAWKIT